jgi:phosphoglycerate dehydrogenase-like enzyme
MPRVLAAGHRGDLAFLDPTREDLAEGGVESVLAPFTTRATHLIGNRRFSRMKPTSLFVNTGRGPIVDEAGLIQARREGKLAGAGLDVQEKEPPDPDNPLLTLEIVVLTPHVASASDKARSSAPAGSGSSWVGC